MKRDPVAGHLLHLGILRLFLPVFVVSTAFAQNEAISPHASTCDAPFNAGFRIVTISGVKTAVWYPTRDAESAYAYSPDMSSTLALNGSFAPCGQLPLVVFSHGFAGCGIQSIFITEQLARHGYVVAAPDHKDALCSVDGSGSTFVPSNEPSLLDPAHWTDTSYADRRTDISNVITGMLGSPDLGSHIDPNRIAGSGHSLGGYTIAGMVGGWDSWRDSRIKAALLFSPYIVPFLLQGRVSAISVPVMYQGAQLDIPLTGFIQGDNGAYGASKSPKFFAELINGTHFEWTNLLCYKIPTIAGCLQAQPNTQVINNYSFAFLDRYMKATPQPLLLSSGPALLDYSRATRLETASAASYAPGSDVSPESIASGFGEGMAPSNSAALSTPLPTSLAGVTVSIIDAQGAQRTAPLFFISPGQINYLVPTGTQNGTATVSVKLRGKEISSGSIHVDNVAPGLFSASATGRGVAAAQFLRVAADGTRTLGLIFDPNTDNPIPVDLGGAGDQVYLQLYGTGMRFASATATVGGVAVPLQGPVPQGQYIGLDQINLGPLPHSLTALGNAAISITANGKTANIVTVNIR